MGFFNVRGGIDSNLPHFDLEEDERPRQPRRKGRQDWIDKNEEEDYALADCSYDRALLDQHRRRKGLKSGRPLTYEERRLIELLDDLDEARRKAHEAALAISSFMNRKDALKLTFERFLKAGGVGGDDFAAMIESDFDLPRVKHRGPLRLVRSRRGGPRRMFNRSKVKSR